MTYLDLEDVFNKSLGRRSPFAFTFARGSAWVAVRLQVLGATAHASALSPAVWYLMQQVWR